MNQEEIEKYLDDMLQNAERDIDRVFANRLKKLNNILGKMHREYGEDGAISRSRIYKYNRFEKEMERIKELIHKDYQEVYKHINRLMREQYKQNYLRSGYVYEMTALQDMGYQIPSAETVNQAILNPIAELRLPPLMQSHRNEIIRKIKIELASGIQAGEGYSMMAKRLKDTVGFSNHKARTVAITEAGRVQVEGRLKSGEVAEQHANLTKTWLSTLDTHTRRTHRRLDGQEADEDGNFTIRGMKAKGPSLFVGPTAARENIRCRCDIYWKVNGQNPQVRRSKDYNDSDYQQKLADRTEQLMADEGLTEKQALRKARRQVFAPNKVIEYQTYEDWHKDLKKEG